MYSFVKCVNSQIVTNIISIRRMSVWYFCMVIAYTDLNSFMFLYQLLDISAVFLLCIAYAMIMIGFVFNLLINT